jgi:exoribonuclease R
MFMNREFNFKLDQDTRYPQSFVEAMRMESKALVEEYMLLANILVGEYILKFCKDKALLRVHNDITADKKEKLYTFFEKVGLKDIDLTSALTLS